MAFIQKTALVYCDDQFGLVDGKTADGLVRYSDNYRIVGVIDRSLAGQDAGEVLGEKRNGIPIFADLATALSQLAVKPEYYIYGKATLDAYISPTERLLILEAIQSGLNIINGLHQFFSDDHEFVAMAAQYEVQIQDIRKPPQLQDLHVFTGQIARVNVPVVAVLGTDCACGKMTTAVALNQALNRLGLKSVMVATGQTGLMQGAQHGASIDALVSQFVIGEIEHAVVQAFEQDRPDIILVEGQSAVSHPAFMSSVGILKGSLPDAVILQHPPARQYRCDFPTLPMPTLTSEIQLIEAIAQTTVMAITLSHENLSGVAVQEYITAYERDLQLPTTDVLRDGCDKLIRTLGLKFPALGQKLKLQSPSRILNKPALAAALDADQFPACSVVASPRQPRY
ncbi:DUF1611 domain-containing protein [filamentous cyanobacterium LEGE 11480]|uniref:DUF1611 domain-containing protein n=1 Tax=Romeriopsis navalis LEGE 11480 TaxID=2777977 RepID=A0A928Z1G7_9CYAN|nr:DUF1611 domain-containing protein [Romeriopsis navalis]MBE9028489.1 DUF1611 domain-containing protein [Romeriopsis navalis LEGE 11480]